MWKKNFNKDVLFILLSTLLVIVYTVSNYYVSSNTIEKTIITGACFAFVWVIFAWVLTHQSHLRKIWPYLLIFILAFIYISYWKIIYFSFNPFSKKIQTVDYNLFENLAYLQIFINFFIILTTVFVIWYLVKPKDFQNKKHSFLKKKNQTKILLSMLIPFIMTIPFWMGRIILFFNSDFYSDIIFSNENMFYWFIFLYNGLPFFFAAILFAVLLNNLKENTRFYLYAVVGLFALIPFLPLYLVFDIQTFDLFTVVLYVLIKNGLSFFFIFLSLLFLSKKRYLE